MSAITRSTTKGTNKRARTKRAKVSLQVTTMHPWNYIIIMKNEGKEGKGHKEGSGVYITGSHRERSAEGSAIRGELDDELS